VIELLTPLVAAPLLQQWRFSREGLELAGDVTVHSLVRTVVLRATGAATTA
jgi:hypothetical protein